VARLAAIAAIRTFLNYFLERDLGAIRTRQGLAPRDRDGLGSSEGRTSASGQGDSRAGGPP
jgi:hypothetical protein